MKTASQNEDFTVINKKNTRVVKTNTTFTVIEELLNEKSAIIQNSGFNCVTIETESGKAFLFKDATQPNHLHYKAEGYVFIERHLRVDRCYSLPRTFQGQHGYTAAHYTEHYQHAKTLEKITIHLYYADSEQYVQVKKSLGKENSEYLDTAKIDKTVRHNGYALIAFYKKLVLEKEHRYFLACKAADQAEVAFKRMWHALATKEQIQSYIAEIDRYCILIDKINSYNEFSIDCRDKFMRSVQDSLQQRLINYHEPVPQVNAVSANEPESSTTAAAGAKPKTSQGKAKPKSPPTEPANQNNTPEIDVEFSNLQKYFLALKKCLNNLTPPKFVEACRLASELNLSLLLYNPTRATLKAAPSRKQKLDAMSKLVNSIPDTYQYCLDFALRGDIKSLAEILPTLTFEMQFNLFTAVYDKLLSRDVNDQSEQAHKLRQVCQHLHDHSPNYRTYLTFYTAIMAVNAKMRLGYSKLIGAAFDKKYLTYVMLVDHGVDIDGLGFFCADLAFSQLKATSLFADKPEYILKLLEKGAIVDAPKMNLSGYWTKSKDIKRAGMTNLFERGTRLDLDFNHDYYSRMKALAALPDLTLACKEYYFVTIPAFLPQISFFNALHALAQCVNTKGISKRIIPQSVERGVFFCTSLDAANQLSDQLCPIFEEANNVAIIAYFADGKFAKDLPYMEKLLQFVKEQCRNHQDKLLQLCEVAEKMAEALPMNDRDVFYLAMQILFSELIHDDPTIDAQLNSRLNLDYRQRLMRVCCLLGAQTKAKRPEYAYIPYYEALCLAQNSAHLQATPIYKHALQKNQQYRTQSNYEATTYKSPEGIVVTFETSPFKPK